MESPLIASVEGPIFWDEFLSMVQPSLKFLNLYAGALGLNWIRSEGWKPQWETYGNGYLFLFPVGYLNNSNLFPTLDLWQEPVFCLRLGTTPCVVLPTSKESWHILDSIRRKEFPLTKSPATFLLAARGISAEFLWKQQMGQCSENMGLDLMVN